MRKLYAVLSALAVLLLASASPAADKPPSDVPTMAVLQQPVRIAPNEILLFDYSDAVMVNEDVTRFEAQYDGGASVDLGIPTKRATGGIGISSYQLDPIRTAGTHNVIVRACNAVGCSGWSSPFAFAPLGAPSTVPGNIRKVPR